MATRSQIESADVPPWRRKRKKTDPSTRGGSTFVDRNLIPDSLSACQIDPDLIDDMRNKIEAFAKDEDDCALLLSMILGE